MINLEHVAYSDIVRGKTRAKDNTGMVWESSVTEGAKAVGVTNQAPFLIDLWKQASRCYGVATYQQVGAVVPGDLGGYRALGVPMTQMIQSGSSITPRATCMKRFRPKAWSEPRVFTHFSSSRWIERRKP